MFTLNYRYGVNTDKNGVLIPAVNTPPANTRAPEPSTPALQPPSRASSGVRGRLDRLANRLPQRKAAE